MQYLSIAQFIIIQKESQTRRSIFLDVRVFYDFFLFIQFILIQIRSKYCVCVLQYISVISMQINQFTFNTIYVVFSYYFFFLVVWLREVAR